MNEQITFANAEQNYLITKRDVANRVCVTTRTIENLMAQGLPHLKLGSRRTRFDWPQVKEWLENRFRVAR
jgi:predicted DNA-binding transcriptional regulator AlpA